MRGYVLYAPEPPDAPLSPPQPMTEKAELLTECEQVLHDIPAPHATRHQHETAERRAMISLAGQLAVETQIEHYGMRVDRDNVWRYFPGSSSDLMSAIKRLSTVMHGDFQHCLQRVEQRTLQALRHPKIHRAVLALAEELACKGTLHRAEILDIIHAAMNDTGRNKSE